METKKDYLNYLNAEVGFNELNSQINQSNIFDSILRKISITIPVCGQAYH